MTPKEKATELVDKFTEYTKVFDDCAGWVNDEISAKQCALIAVDEIIEVMDYDYTIPKEFGDPYWVAVKQEIEKI